MEGMKFRGVALNRCNSKEIFPLPVSWEMIVLPHNVLEARGRHRTVVQKESFERRHLQGRNHRQRPVMLGSLCTWQIYAYVVFKPGRRKHRALIHQQQQSVTGPEQARRLRGETGNHPVACKINAKPREKKRNLYNSSLTEGELLWKRYDVRPIFVWPVNARHTD